MRYRLAKTINQRIDKLLSYPGCTDKKLNTRKTLWLASLIGLLFVLPLTIYLTILYPKASYSLYYNYYVTIVLIFSVLIIPYLKKFFNLFIMVETTVRLFVTFYFTLKLGGIVFSFGMLFVALAYIFLTIPLNIIWFTKTLFGLYCILTVFVSVLGSALKAPDEQMLSYDLKALFSIINILFMSALALYFVVSFMKNQQKLEELEAVRQKEMNEAKTRLFTNITHEFRTPLTVISGMADLIEGNPEIWIPEGTTKIKNNSNLMLRLVNQLLNISKIEAKAMPVHLIKGDIVRYISLIVELHRSAAIEKEISLELIRNNNDMIMDFDPDIIAQITSNLIGNAIKFTPEKGVVEIKSEINEKDGLFYLQVSDTGKGIPEDKIQYVFDRFYQVENHANSGGGTGLGLALVKELTTLINGKIEVESQPDKGSVFTIRIPVTRKAEPVERYFKSVYKIEDSDIKDKKKIPAYPVEKNNTNLPRLLVVEDSKDVSFYLSGILSGEYNISFAENGKRGLDKAIKKIPDIIISDVMMPEMDGIEMLEKLKTDFRTSHIPIILLTAKADIESRLEGLERGAEAYITKPFNENELRVQLKNLVELRKKLHDRYSSLANFTESQNPELKNEDAFVLKVRKILEQNLDNESFSINNLCREMAVSHTQLYRKFKSISNLSIADYFKLLRLNNAKELLSSSPEMNITQIAFAVGFKSLSQFSREFASQFGLSPKEFKNKLKVNPLQTATL